MSEIKTPWRDVKLSTPDAHPIDMPNGTYYYVIVEDFGEQRAMFLVDNDGVKGWYVSYIAKIFRNVTHYLPKK